MAGWLVGWDSSRSDIPLDQVSNLLAATNLKLCSGWTSGDEMKTGGLGVVGGPWRRRLRCISLPDWRSVRRLGRGLECISRSNEEDVHSKSSVLP